MLSVAPAASAGAEGARALGAALVRRSTFALVAVTVALSGRRHGAYDVSVWAPLGLVLVSAVAIGLGRGRRPSRGAAVAAGCLAALGGWSVLSTGWGGLPQQAWTVLDQSLIAAAALLLGSMLSRRRRLVLRAVLAGVVAQAVEILVRAALGAGTGGWFYGRFLEGPVGYHNAQGVMFALAVPIGTWLMCDRTRAARMAGGASVGILLSALLLTQSRGALLAAGLAAAVQLAAARSARLALRLGMAVLAAVALALALRPVDAALLTSDAAGRLASLRSFALWAALVSVALALAAVPELRVTRFRRPLALGLAALVLLALPLAALEGSFATRAASFVSELRSDAPPESPPGNTRLVSLSLNGRRDAWRVAWNMTAAAPLAGAGTGEFARRWTVERRIAGLYVLQPHSIELELASELGLVGIGLFAAFGALAVASLLRARARAAAAAALAVITTLVAEASIDWTWSFPGLVVPALLVVGAAARGGGARARPVRLLPLLGAVPSLAVVLLAIALPYLADRRLGDASAARPVDAGLAWTRAEAARRLDPWNADLLDLEGSLAEGEGHYLLAARLYGRAADRSQRPWMERYRQARALEQAGAVDASRRVCARAIAGNPGEPLLRTGPCAPAVGS